MIAASRSLAAMAFVLAVVIHAALGWALMADVEVEIEGSAGAREARLGTSFADMAIGTLEATEAEEMAEPVEPDVIETAEPETMQPVPVQPEIAEPLVPDRPEVVAALEPDAVPTIEAAKPETPASEERDAPVKADRAEEVVEAEESEAVSRSLRPRQRSAAFEKKNEPVVRKPAPEPARKPEKAPAPKAQPRGNAEQNNTAGAATGNAAARAATSGNAGGSAATSGNAAASNYPGKVMQRLSRAARPRVGARGTAVIAFTVAGGGGLAGVSVARSSGSAALDRAAARMVQSAAPFPPPPPGAQRSFSISIEGR